MAEKIILNEISKGLRQDRTAFNIDNDSFPFLQNAYQWRGRIKRKRGTSLLTRLQRYFDSLSKSYNFTTNTDLAFVGGVSPSIYTNYSLNSSSQIVPGTVVITDTTTHTVYKDVSSPALPIDGTIYLSGTQTSKGNINYSTGIVTISDVANHSTTLTFSYYPDLPVMGLEPAYPPVANTSGVNLYIPGTVGFDTTFSYNIQGAIPTTSYSVSFFKNPPSNPAINYVAKTVWTPSTWNGANYQQFWSTNYNNALWTTNGINVPFTGSNIGMQFAPSNTITFVGQTPTSITLTITNCPLVIGDFVFFNEWGASTAANAQTLNFQTGYVTASSDNTPPPPNSTRTVTITFQSANLAADVYVPGILQYLTTRVNTALDCIRWYDGDPTAGGSTNQATWTANGWVNFCPPLSQGTFSISNLPPAQYYLVGARLIQPFKDRLVFFGPVVQSSGGSPQYLPDTVIYSGVGTPFYTASFQGPPTIPTIISPILTPTNVTSFPSIWFMDIPGFGGFQTLGIDQPIITANPNSDVIIMGFGSNIQVRMIYSGNDLVPFQFYIINSEFPSGSTFSAVVLDQGIISKGNRGIILSTQTAVQRIDLEIPDQVFECALNNNGAERTTATRDFINEWILITYPGIMNTTNVFPNETLFYNYRDSSWAIFLETYTTYGQFIATSGNTWLTLPSDLTWNSWTYPWNAGESTIAQPEVIGGNTQGFVLLLNQEETSEASSLYIQAVSGAVVTSPNHMLNNGDYIFISGDLTPGSPLNGKIFQVYNVSTTQFSLSGLNYTLTYVGGALITRIYIPVIQSKQFNPSWGMSRKTRIGRQLYLLQKSNANNSQVTLQMQLSMDSATAWNSGNIVPDVFPDNNSLIYSQIIFTCPELTNIGLTPANINLQQVTANTQQQIWHRVNTSLIGDVVQFTITLSPTQVTKLDPNGNFISQFAEIELHSAIIDVYPSQELA